MILGITGGTGCGKTTLLQMVKDAGGLVLDCDEIYHRLLQEDSSLLNAILQAFPGAAENGVLHRKKLGNLVFSNPDALNHLNEITHSAVRREVLRQLDRKPELAAIDAIALFESGLSKLCDVTVAVTAPVESRVQRLMVRDQIDEAYARSRIAAQHDDTWFRRHCDYILENNGTKIQFQRKCLAFFRTFDIMKEKR